MEWKNRDWSGERGVTRSAKLSSWRRASPLPREWHQTGWIVWGFGLLVVLLRLSEPLAPDEAIRWATAMGFLVFLIPGGLILEKKSVEWILQEPEPMDRSGSAELAEAYADYRHRRLWGMALLTRSMTVLLTLLGATMAWLPTSSGGIGGWIGGIGGGLGALVGVGGGVFGFYCSLHRAKIASLLRQLSESQST